MPSTRSWAQALAAVVALAGALACPKKTPTKPPPKDAPTRPAGPDRAKQFITETESKLRELRVDVEVKSWEHQTNVTEATTKAAAGANERLMAFLGEAIPAAAEFDKAKTDADTRRKLDLLKRGTELPAPKDAEKRRELASLATQMTSIYGQGRYCQRSRCQHLGELERVLARSRNVAKLKSAWAGWRTIAVQMRPMYQRFVGLANEGAKEIGYADVGELWRSGYDMPPSQFAGEMERLWGQVQPLYEQLHCHVRAKLAAKYGRRVSTKGPIPAHLLGNMWAQTWGNVYKLVEPYRGLPEIDVTPALEQERYDAVAMVKMAEKFFVSLGLDPLPETFWERSLFEKPEDREVVCHASAWDVTFSNDLRLKMCVRTTMEDLITVHHELGHNYYYHYYYQLPFLYQNGAHDGFHEGIGDTLALSVTPPYLKQVGLLAKVSSDDRAVINQQMLVALEKIAFLPFGLLVDKWRWGVFAGDIGPERYNAAWWELRLKYQGIAPSKPRGEEFFDPGAKYHIPANTPYSRYFLARILQFQFHKALCEESGHTGPLHECSIYGSKKAGAKLKAMLKLGASKPWPEALHAIAATRQMDGSAMIEYFDPLMQWLKKQNEGRACGWEGA